MTKAGKQTKPSSTIDVKADGGESLGASLARVLLRPYARHGHSASSFAEPMLGNSAEKPEFMDYADFVEARAREVEKGELGMASQMLAAQAITLDTMFAEFARWSALNMGEYIHAAERYGRLAMKAQSNCRATLDTLAKLHQPREQTVRHVHVNEGGQAIVADEFHQHTGGGKNGLSAEQSHAPNTRGSAGASAALPGPDPLGNGVPIPGGEREAAMQDARRD